MDDKLTTKRKIGGGASGSLHDRLRQAGSPTTSFEELQSQFTKNMRAAVGGATNKIALLPDFSGSMNSSPDGKYDWSQPTQSTKIGLAREAFQAFIEAIDFSNTAVSVEAICSSDTRLSLPLSNVSGLILPQLLGTPAGGGTPMHYAMSEALKQPIGRAIIISDGEADNPMKAIEEARRYASQEIPIDCVHIGSEASGEETLKQIAQITGGIYMKFTDVKAFAANFKFLTPQNRLRLTSGSAGALGASEVKVFGK